MGCSWTGEREGRVVGWLVGVMEEVGETLEKKRRGACEGDGDRPFQ